MADTGTIGIQVKTGGKAATVTGILRNSGDQIILTTENPGVEISFNYLQMLEFLYSVEREQKKLKMKRM